jgi:catechol 2,3-dioxygenase-like lactoylglutathione lyase family enzyme
MNARWPADLPAVQLRISRPTSQLERVTAFYRDGLGLPVLYSYEHDAEYDGVMFGLPGRDYNLEITQHAGDGPCPAPLPDSLLVFYLLDTEALAATEKRLEAMGYTPVPARNPYWEAHGGVTISDPDGWHVVLAHSHGFGPEYGP